MPQPEQERRPVVSQAADASSTRIRFSSSTRVRRARVVVAADTISITGPGIFDALRPYDFRPIFIGGGFGAWVVDRFKREVDRAGDLIAALEHAGYVVSVAKGGDAA